MDAAQVELAFQFGKQLLPPGRRAFGPPSVADLVAADDEHARRRVTFQKLGKHSHENMKAPIGFEIARAVRNQKVVAR
jgi:hypothetical protein